MHRAQAHGPAQLTVRSIGLLQHKTWRFLTARALIRVQSMCPSCSVQSWVHAQAKSSKATLWQLYSLDCVVSPSTRTG